PSVPAVARRQAGRAVEGAAEGSVDVAGPHLFRPALPGGPGRVRARDDVLGDEPGAGGPAGLLPVAAGRRVPLPELGDAVADRGLHRRGTTVGSTRGVVRRVVGCVDQGAAR